MTDLAAAWAEACRRLERLAERVCTSGDFPDRTDADRADGIAHLVEQAVCWLTWEVFHADARRPVYQRQNDLVTQWGGPNADNVYRHARVDAARRYRLRGRMHACDDFILAMRAGFMHLPTWGTLHEVSASTLGIGRGDEFELLLGGDDPGAIPVPPGTISASIREYYFDWSADEPATFVIECLDDDADTPGERLSESALAARLATAVDGVEHSVEYWNRWLLDERAKQPVNTFGAPHVQAKGLDAARYAYCFFDLAPGDALVVDGEVPAARYWSFQLYEMGWFELVDQLERQTSLNHTQVAVDRDGRVRLVVAADDPAGVANWLDSGGRRTGLLLHRWFWPSGDGLAAMPSTAVVPVTDVRSVLSPATTTVDAASRAATLRHRRQHLTWRFRT